MRVLHFYQVYAPESYGGVEQMIYQICEGTRVHGIDNSVLTLSNDYAPRTIELGSHTVHRAKRLTKLASTGLSIDVFSKFRELVQSADLVHYQFPWPLMDIVHFCVRPDVPTLVTYQSDIVRQKNLLRLYSPLMHRFLADTSCIVATSPNYFHTSPVLRYHRDKVRIIPNGIELATYPPVDWERRERWKQSLGNKFFLFIGVMRYYKGLHILLEAARSVNVPIVIVGAGPIEEELKALADQWQLHHVKFLGAVDDHDKVALLDLCHAMVFPSHLRSEAFGVSLLEGAAFGKPLISSEIGTGTSYININGQTGHVVAPGDASALAQAMNKVWHDPVEASRMGEAARLRYRQLFTGEAMCNAYASLYRELHTTHSRRKRTRS